MKVVDTLAEQEQLERLLEETKPPVPPECRQLHYLLSTPFRYGSPYPRGSRFRRAGLTPGVFYASVAVTTAIAEVAFRRLLFFAESPGTPWPGNAGEYTAFAVKFRTSRGLDLNAPPFNRRAADWRDPTNYAACQALAETARTAGVDAICYDSVRGSGRSVALLRCAAFASPEPIARQSWRLHVGPPGVRAICAWPEQAIGFDRSAFAVDPRIASLRWDRP